MKIAICGSAPSSAELAPFEDETWQDFRQGLPAPHNIGAFFPTKFTKEKWDIWGCSPAFAGQARRATRWFETHRWEPGANWFQPAYMNFLREFQGPVYVGGPPGAIPKEDIPNQIPYPTQRVVDEFTPYFLTSSLALMAAVAILEIEDMRRQFPNHDPSEDVLAFFGVDMAAHEEWSYQRPGCHHFIVEAVNRNIGIYVPPESCLLIPMPIYGLCEWEHKYIKMTQRSREVNARKNELQNLISQYTQQLSAVSGEAVNLDYYVNTMLGPQGYPAGAVVRKNVEPRRDHPEDNLPTGGRAETPTKRGRPRSEKRGNGPLATESGLPD